MIQTARWTTGTAIIAVRPVTASHLPITPHLNPMHQSTSIPWVTRTVTPVTPTRAPSTAVTSTMITREASGERPVSLFTSHDLKTTTSDVCLFSFHPLVSFSQTWEGVSHTFILYDQCLVCLFLFHRTLSSFSAVAISLPLNTYTFFINILHLFKYKWSRTIVTGNKSANKVSK